ncbi:spore germination protein KC [Bacillus sp. SLBN-46]|jgi:spore germination protein KC|uniref:Ger(x)C family spore germination protein n=1 Tax=Bacillus sp. SLBN-46 TaxID=3042283 RepID=UPI002857AD7B|nr:Ger(x)C family spore germination protein [Bacillus sp. SLBN-46]MDR6123829.1 spore germination protein KC [Bacillus sp. SLBN-46]
MKKCINTILILLLLLPVLSGCWNQKELTDLAFVMALGIDKGKEKKFNLSFQLVNPSNVSSGQTGGGNGLPIAVYKSSGDTITEAARNATKKVSRRLYYAHTNVVVISEEVAKESLLYVLDALDRDPEFRTTTELVIARGSKAEDIVTTLTILDRLPVTKITKQIKFSESMLGENISLNIDDFLIGLLSKGKQPIANGYRLVGDKPKARKAENLQKTTTDAFLQSDGLAVFNKGILRGWINHDKARGIVWVLDKVQSTDININWEGKKNALSIAPIRSKTKVSVRIVNDKPIINVKNENEGWISEANTAIDLDNPEIIAQIEKLTEKEITRQIRASVKEAQKLKSDILGFGEKVHIENPPLWKKIQGNWDEEFADLQVNVHVDSYIRRQGIRTKPFWSNMQQ